MAHFTTKPNYDVTFGHKFFQSALDIAIRAEEQEKPQPVALNRLEAVRLYRIAIQDATAGLVEIHGDADWSLQCASVAKQMEARILMWQSRCCGDTCISLVHPKSGAVIKINPDDVTPERLLEIKSRLDRAVICRMTIKDRTPGEFFADYVVLAGPEAGGKLWFGGEGS